MTKLVLLFAAVALAACGRPTPAGHAPPALPTAHATSAPVTVAALTMENAIARPPLGGQTTVGGKSQGAEFGVRHFF